MPPLAEPEGYLVMADAAGALMTGLVVRAGSASDTATRIMRLAGHGSTETADWAWPAYHLAGLVLGHLEPDPDVTWDETQHARWAATIDEMLHAVAQTRPAPT